MRAEISESDILHRSKQTPRFINRLKSAYAILPLSHQTFTVVPSQPAKPTQDDRQDQKECRWHQDHITAFAPIHHSHPLPKQC
jgi:hypothetical protein